MTQLDFATPHNPNCDGNGPCSKVNKEVRVLPYGGGGNLLLCRACLARELAFRKERNAHVAVPYDLPEWYNLEIYGE